MGLLNGQPGPLQAPPEHAREGQADLEGAQARPARRNCELAPGPVLGEHFAGDELSRVADGLEIQFDAQVEEKLLAAAAGRRRQRVGQRAMPLLESPQRFPAFGPVHVEDDESCGTTGHEADVRARPAIHRARTVVCSRGSAASRARWGAFQRPDTAVRGDRCSPAPTAERSGSAGSRARGTRARVLAEWLIRAVSDERFRLSVPQASPTSAASSSFHPREVQGSLTATAVLVTVRQYVREVLGRVGRAGRRFVGIGKKNCKDRERSRVKPMGRTRGGTRLCEVLVR